MSHSSCLIKKIIEFLRRMKKSKENTSKIVINYINWLMIWKFGCVSPNSRLEHTKREPISRILSQNKHKTVWFGQNIKFHVGIWTQREHTKWSFLLLFDFISSKRVGCAWEDVQRMSIDLFLFSSTLWRLWLASSKEIWIN